MLMRKDLVSGFTDQDQHEMRANTRVGEHIGQRALSNISEIDLPDAQEREEEESVRIWEENIA